MFISTGLSELLDRAAGPVRHSGPDRTLPCLSYSWTVSRILLLNADSFANLVETLGNSVRRRETEKVAGFGNVWLYWTEAFQILFSDMKSRRTQFLAQWAKRMVLLSSFEIWFMSAALIVTRRMALTEDFCVQTMKGPISHCIITKEVTGWRQGPTRLIPEVRILLKGDTAAMVPVHSSWTSVHAAVWQRVVSFW